ncbi:MAG: M48 family metallopeptidase [Bernardetiaceae bacterium]
MKKRQILHAISSRTWEHPADRAALETLRKIPALDSLLQRVFGETSERSLRLMYLASTVRVSPRQFGRLDALFGEACQILDVERPELFVTQSPFLNAGAVGMERPFVVLNSSIAQGLDDEEILSVMGHELGHILSGHVLYKTLLMILLRFSQLLIRVPIGDLAISGLLIALNEWSRKSELSADRAELLTVQNPDVPIRALMKLAGGTDIEEMHLGEFLAQAEEYEQSDSVRDSLFKIFNVLNQSHPFAVVRVAELLKWVRSGEYDRILNGTYTKRDQAPAEDIFTDYRTAAQTYQEDFTAPLENVVQDAARRARNIMDGLLGKKDPE